MTLRSSSYFHIDSIQNGMEEGVVRRCRLQQNSTCCSAFHLVKSCSSASLSSNKCHVWPLNHYPTTFTDSIRYSRCILVNSQYWSLRKVMLYAAIIFLPLQWLFGTESMILIINLEHKIGLWIRLKIMSKVVLICTICKNIQCLKAGPVCPKHV